MFSLLTIWLTSLGAPARYRAVLIVLILLKLLAHVEACFDHQLINTSKTANLLLLRGKTVGSWRADGECKASLLVDVGRAGSISWLAYLLPTSFDYKGQQVAHHIMFQSSGEARVV